MKIVAEIIGGPRQDKNLQLDRYERALIFVG
jgi:hypothetical protein